MRQAFCWEVLQSFSDSWVQLGTPGGGKIGYIKHLQENDEPWPGPMVAFQSDQIDNDVAGLLAKGLKVSDVVKADHMWHASYVDHHGNKYLIWQEPDK